MLIMVCSTSIMLIWASLEASASLLNLVSELEVRRTMTANSVIGDFGLLVITMVFAPNYFAISRVSAGSFVLPE